MLWAEGRCVMAACCQGRASGVGRKLSTITPSVVPGLALLLLPKCPLCLAAWLTVATGLSFSAGGATWVRAGIVIVWVAGLMYLVWKRMRVRVAW